MDGTLYPADNGFLHKSRERLVEFIYSDCELDRSEDALALWKQHFKKYNQSLKSLRDGAGFSFDEDRLWQELRRDGPQFFKPDPEVIDAIQGLKQRKVIFTNCREKEGIECLKLLGLADEFEEVYGSDFMGTTAKPQKEAFVKLLKHLDVEPSRAILFEDSRKNLHTAKSLGMGAVFIHREGKEHIHESVTAEELEGLDAVVPKIGEELKRQLPQLWWNNIISPSSTILNLLESSETDATKVDSNAESTTTQENDLIDTSLVENSKQNCGKKRSRES
mmetsp:Transcript_13713/g.17868  ORF Transcript_13713/g.17868 Transcript_13713/m.17868 type:complete len:277 (-) Transcript_13713:157-987(-)